MQFKISEAGHEQNRSFGLPQMEVRESGFAPDEYEENEADAANGHDRYPRSEENDVTLVPLAERIAERRAR